jgi:hypothetical protein
MLQEVNALLGEDIVASLALYAEAHGLQKMMTVLENAASMVASRCK